MELLTNSLGLGTSVTNLFVRDWIRTVLTKELTGVISQNVRISQDRLVSFVLIGEFLKQIYCFDQLTVGGDQ